MKWLEIAIYVKDEGIEPVCGVLSGVGIDQVSIEESRERAMAFLNESALYWDFADASKIGTETPCVKAYLADLPESVPLLESIKAGVNRLKTLDLGIDPGPLTLVVSRVEDADWENNWKKYYKPLPIGDRLLVLPSWEAQPPCGDRRILKLDPGVAFGTGAHHTTRMCLEFLEREVKPGGKVLDLGCGSGILSIASLLLGAASAVAVDIDPIAEHIVRENAAMNGLTDQSLSVYTGDVLSDEAVIRKIRGTYDLVVANIVADVIIRLCPLAKACCKKGAPFIVSGIIDERLEEVCARLKETGFVQESVHSAEGWNAVLSRAQ